MMMMMIRVPIPMYMRPPLQGSTSTALCALISELETAASGSERSGLSQPAGEGAHVGVRRAAAAAEDVEA